MVEREEAGHPSPSGWLTTGRGAGLAGLASVLVCLPALRGELVIDDRYLILDNPSIRSLGGIARHFTRAWGGGLGPSGHAAVNAGYFRPLSTVLHTLEYVSFGPHPLGWHAVSLLLHTLCTALVVWLAAHVFASARAGLVAGLLFAVHPVHTEAIAAPSYQTSLLAACFGLAAMAALALSATPGRRRWAGCLLAGVLSLMAGLAKEEGLVVPIWGVAWLVLVGAKSTFMISEGRGCWGSKGGLPLTRHATRVGLSPRRGERRSSLGGGGGERRSSLGGGGGEVVGALGGVGGERRSSLGGGGRQEWPGWPGVASVVLGGVCAAVWRATIVTGSQITFFGTAGLAVIAPTMVGVVALYARLLLVPLQLCPFYDWFIVPPSSRITGDVVAGAVLMVAVVAGILALRRRAPGIALGLAWLALGLLPVMQLVPTLNVAAERFLYLPSAGFALAGAGLLVWAHARAPRAALIVGAAVVVLFSARTLARWPDWHDDRRLSQATAASFPETPTPLLNLAEMEAAAGHPVQAARYLEEAEKRAPGWPGTRAVAARIAARAANSAVRPGQP